MKKTFNVNFLRIGTDINKNVKKKKTNGGEEVANIKELDIFLL